MNVDGVPPARFAGTLFIDHQRGRLLLFGGLAAVAKTDVWELVGASPASDGPDPGADPEPAALSVSARTATLGCRRQASAPAQPEVNT